MDYNLILQNIKEWAKKLLIVQYSQANRNKKLIDYMVDLVFANNLIIKIRDLCLNVDKSEGAQLDVIGLWVGINRFYTGALFEDNRFSLVNYSNIKSNTYFPGQGGFSNYTNFNTLLGGLLTYKEWLSRIANLNKMGDYYFRELIKLKIIKNSIVFTNKNIDDAIYKWSNGNVYTTWDTMKVTYHYKIGYFQIMQIAQLKGVLLAPTGCTIEIEEQND